MVDDPSYTAKASSSSRSSFSESEKERAMDSDSIDSADKAANERASDDWFQRLKNGTYTSRMLRDRGLSVLTSQYHLVEAARQLIGYGIGLHPASGIVSAVLNRPCEARVCM